MASTTSDSEHYEYDKIGMKAAIDQAIAATAAGKMPFGAVLMDDATGTVICAAHNQITAANKRGGSGSSGDDVTRHAEMELVRKFTDSTMPAAAAAAAASPVSTLDRSKCTLYTSTEPCVMCAGAIYWSGVGRVVYGCSAAQLAFLSGPGGFDIPLEQLYDMAAPGTRKIQVKGPFLAQESLAAHAAAGVWKYAPAPVANKTALASTPVAAPTLTNSQAAQDIAVEASLKETGLGSAAVVDDGVVPVIDMSLSDEEVSKQLWEAATTVGFFSVVNHGIDQSLVDAAFGSATQFFGQSVEDKKAQSPLDMSINSGFEYFSQVRPSTGVADQKESLQITARTGCMNGRWPSNPPDFTNSSQTLMTAAHGLANRLLTLLEPLATPHLPPGTLADAHTLWSDQGQCTLRFLHYPPIITSPEATAKLLKEGYWRAGPHTDWDCLTILFQQLGQNGLECCANPRTGNPSDMYWTAVNPVESGIAVNIGDMLARWSDGRLYSNLHRVRLPLAIATATGAGADAAGAAIPMKSRYSIAFFAQADKDVLIESKESEPITAGDYILSRIRSNFAST
jgi:isopenicillin N synthase-like dioxygenase/tRNA(Arg) A34 adenosine deaminase TadA